MRAIEIHAGAVRCAAAPIRLFGVMVFIGLMIALSGIVLSVGGLVLSMAHDEPWRLQFFLVSVMAFIAGGIAACAIGRLVEEKLRR